MTVLAWIALIFGATWIYMFIVSVTRDFKAKPATDTYKAICFLFLVLFAIFSMTTLIGVVING